MNILNNQPLITQEF